MPLGQPGQSQPWRKSAVVPCWPQWSQRRLLGARLGRARWPTGFSAGAEPECRLSADADARIRRLLRPSSCSATIPATKLMMASWLCLPGSLVTGAGLEPASPAWAGALAIKLPWFILPLRCVLVLLDMCRSVTHLGAEPMCRSVTHTDEP